MTETDRINKRLAQDGRVAYKEAKNIDKAFIVIGNGIYRMLADGTKSKVADLSTTRVKNRRSLRTSDGRFPTTHIYSTTVLKILICSRQKKMGFYPLFRIMFPNGLPLMSLMPCKIESCIFFSENLTLTH